jgi:nucleoside-diphosphate-sugar epimerase
VVPAARRAPGRGFPRPEAGAPGFVGRRLCPALAAAGHHVVAMTRNPADHTGAGRPVHGDVHDPSASAGRLRGALLTGLPLGAWHGRRGYPPTEFRVGDLLALPAANGEV